jgi:hypothetical protein
MEARQLSDTPAPAFGLSLRIRHPSIDPQEISRELQLEPEHSFRAGEPRNSSSGLAATATHAESYWLSALNPFINASPFEGLRARAGQPPGLDTALALCATHLARRHAPFFSRVIAEGGQIGLLVEVAPDAVRAFSIAPAVSRTLAELGISLEFEFEPAG